MSAKGMGAPPAPPRPVPPFRAPPPPPPPPAASPPAAGGGFRAVPPAEPRVTPDLPPPPPKLQPAAPPAGAHRTRLGAPSWWYLLDRRLMAVAVAVLVLITGAGAFAAFRPTTAPSAPAAEVATAPGAAAKGRFIQQADLLCERAANRIKALTFPTTQTEAVAYVTAGLAINRTLLNDLRALDAPKQDRRDLRRVLRSFDRSMAAADDYLGAIRSGNPSAMAAAERRAANVSIRANGLARAYGFGACAEGA